jgi:NAD(P)-dependent dehydrogenase (short-subunit alcohol dehydrogenase family)
MVAQTVAAFGRLDAAYNNAGVQNVLAERLTAPARITTASWRSISAANGAA